MKKLFFIIPIFLLLAACQIAFPNSDTISVSIKADGNSKSVSVPKGTTVQQALLSANIELNSLDRVEPPLSSVVNTESQIKVIRVVEEFDVEESLLPFENQTVKNESMPEGKTVLIQPGVNGKISTTYRVLKEDEVIVSRTIVKSETLEESKPEIVMIGVQSPFVSLPIEGKLAYITSSSAWVIENNTGNRRPLVTSGDLDGRIFSISPDRNWLLFSRLPSSSESSPSINSLWVINLQTSNPEPIALGVSNVVHFADWVPGKPRTIAYSTVEPRNIPPGWQANNDLKTMEFDETGSMVNQETIIDVNSGGIYGWWGAVFSFSPDGNQIAYARPDSIGLVNTATGELDPKINLIPYQTGGDWAWVPSLTWSPDSKILFSVLHGPANSTKADETSTQFDMAAMLIDTGTIIRLYPNSGMFANAKPSTVKSDSTYLLGILTSILPTQSETSKYDLRIMDRDGSNIQKLYPGEGIQGLNPQQITWSPQSHNNGMTLGFLAQENIMLVDVSSDSISQVSGDGTVSKFDWK